MSDPFVPRVGGILSADIAVPELEREVRFYSRVLSTGENPLWREDLTNNRGMPIIGVGARSADHADLPLQWMPHIQVADVAASVERALDLSGSELMHAKDDAGKSQWAGLLDPNGAAFGIIPVLSAEAYPSAEGVASRDVAVHVGCISRIDLTVSDASATREFYRQVVDWSVQDVDMEDAGERYADYNMLGGDGTGGRGQDGQADHGGRWRLRACGRSGPRGRDPGAGTRIEMTRSNNGMNLAMSPLETTHADPCRLSRVSPGRPRRMHP